MTKLSTLALPVPAIGHGIGEIGDAYVASLAIEIDVDGRVVARLDGTTFEAIMSTAEVRHLAFHPRTRAFVACDMKAPSLTARIERNWSGIDSWSNDLPGIVDAAIAIAAACRNAGGVAWRQVN